MTALSVELNRLVLNIYLNVYRILRMIKNDSYCDFEYNIINMYKLLHESDRETAFVGTRINFTD